MKIMKRLYMHVKKTRISIGYLRDDCISCLPAEHGEDSKCPPEAKNNVLQIGVVQY